MPKQGSVLNRFRSFDAYAKTVDEFRVKTTAGATVTMLSALLIAVLVLSEFWAYRTITLKTDLIVDPKRKEKMPISLNITFPRVPCYLLSLDVMDDAGEHLNDYTHDLYRVRLDQWGKEINKEKELELGDKSSGAELALAKNEDPNYCGSCYGGDPVAEANGCCNTCEEVRAAYTRKGWGFQASNDIEQCVREGWADKLKTQSNEGCNINGHLIVNKVRGNFHIAPGRSFQQQHMHVHDMQSYFSGAQEGAKFDFSHTIHFLQFGDEIKDSGMVNPLDGTSKTTDQLGMMYQYFLKIVSTEFTFLNKQHFYTNQFAVTQHERVLGATMSGLPGVFFNFDISPMLIVYTETRTSFTSFLTGVCAIIGGIFTVASMIDGFIYRAERSLKKKMEMGKAL